ncbi:MAG TPA: NAD(P)-dependent oxidoreductase [Actinopolymorphaceae bacterium]|jgi:nucleoside-diphosphate-sugar epimerase
MKILVTGGRGRIGSRSVLRLVGLGHEVVSADTAETRGPDVDPREVELDIRDLDAMTAAATGCDAIVHAGAIPGDRGGQMQLVLNTNVDGTLNVLLAATDLGITRIVAFSSINAIGVVGRHGTPPDRLPFDDTHPHRPYPGYQLSKHLGEEACTAFADAYGMTIISLRPVLVTEEHRYESWRAGNRHDIDWVRREFGAYVDVEDVVDAVVAGLTVEVRGHHAVLLAADDTGMTQPTAELAAAVFPEVPWVGTTQEEWLAGDPHRGFIDTRGARELLGWRATRGWRTPPA